jgi:DNA-binding FrmR family transcriptional regulator
MGLLTIPPLGYKESNLNSETKMKSVKVATAVVKKAPKSDHSHPDHSAHLKQLARVKGQVEGIEKMIKDGRYCVDIINQIKAIIAGLKVVESGIFDSHLNSCVQQALASKNSTDVQAKINEINKLIYGSKSK